MMIMPKPFGNGCGKGKAGANRTTNDEIIWGNIYKLEVYITSSNREQIEASTFPDELKPHIIYDAEKP